VSFVDHRNSLHSTDCRLWRFRAALVKELHS